MTVKAGASSAISKWSDIDWKAIKEGVNRLQMRIVKATKQGKIGKVKALQWISVHSYYAKLLACNRVTSSKVSRTAGIDGKLYKTDSAKIKLASSLKVRGYKASPTRRVYIPKKGSEQRSRPLSIPTIYDRSMQALYFLALEPIAESHADENSYGFRQHRSAADAIEQIFATLCQKYSGLSH